MYALDVDVIYFIQLLSWHIKLKCVTPTHTSLFMHFSPWYNKCRCWCAVCSLSGSVPSLAAGVVFGGLAGFGAYQISNDPKQVWVSLGNYTDNTVCVPWGSFQFLNKLYYILFCSSCVFQLHQELWLVWWERGSTDPGSSCQLAWWLQQGICHMSKLIYLTYMNIFKER